MQPPEGIKCCSVSEVTRQVNNLLAEAFRVVWVAGELSDVKVASSGHLYLTLKDDQSQIRAVVWRSAVFRMRFRPKIGLEVIAGGRLGIYSPRGEYQLIVDALYPKGEGAQEQALRQLREKLASRGFFSQARKRPLPRFPKRIAVVTSRKGAAVRDILEILGRRWPSAEVLVAPVQVQGGTAAWQISAAIRAVNRVTDVDVLILARGGGSSDDLAPFNDEIVAEAIFASDIPIVSAVGHEVDVTIADQVADRRALTPSEAAELVTPSRSELLVDFQERQTRLKELLVRNLEQARKQLHALAQRRPFREPLERVEQLRKRLDQTDERLRRAIQLKSKQARERMEYISGRLGALSPLHVLGRGFSLTQKEDGQIVREPSQVKPGDRLTTRVHGGSIVSSVEQATANSSDHDWPHESGNG